MNCKEMAAIFYFYNFSVKPPPPPFKVKAALSTVVLLTTLFQIIVSWSTLHLEVLRGILKCGAWKEARERLFRVKSEFHKIFTKCPYLNC